MISERAFCVAMINAVRPSYYSILLGIEIIIVVSQQEYHIPSPGPVH